MAGLADLLHKEHFPLATCKAYLILESILSWTLYCIPEASFFTWGAGYPSGESEAGDMSHRWWRRRMGYWHLDFPGDFKSPGLRRRLTRGIWSRCSSCVSCDWLTVTRSPNRSPRYGFPKLVTSRLCKESRLLGQTNFNFRTTGNMFLKDLNKNPTKGFWPIMSRIYWPTLRLKLLSQCNF